MEPLAAKIRPKNLKEFIGQQQLVGPGKPLRAAIEQGHVFSFVLWGPPGVGKTTLARIYAKAIHGEFFELSAVSAGKEDIKKIVNKKDQAELSVGGPKVLFLDEVHRFNKAQQDFLLPYVETGRLVLVGATTENPSFEIIPALLSRLRVFVLEVLSEQEISKIIDRTGQKLDQEAKDWLINIANGDARQAITLIENASKLYGKITVETLTQTVQSKFLRYDKKGEEHYNTISAFIKSLRASQPDAALYYLARMVEAGEDPKFIARRLVIFASEDVGMAQPTAVVVANAAFRAVEIIGLPEAAINLAQATVYLAAAKKDKSAYEGYFAALEDVREHGNLPVPLKIRNAPTKLMKNLGYGQGYERYTADDLLPEKLKGKKYWLSKSSNPPKLPS